MLKLFKNTAFWEWLILMLVLRVITFAPVPFIQENQAAFFVGILLYYPIFRCRGALRTFFEDNWKQFLKNIGLGLGVAVLILGLPTIYGLLNPSSFFIEAFDPVSIFFYQLAIVALPEEFFFRGYLYQKIQIGAGKRLKIGPLWVSGQMVLNSTLFAISHSLIFFQPWHALIFFPSLMFCWLRERTGTITASIVFHACCNLFGAWFVAGLD